MSDRGTGAETETEEVVDLTDEAELADLRAENERLRAELEQQRGPMWRRIVAAMLAVLAIIVLIAAVWAVWQKTTLEDEDAFVSTFEPLPSQEPVATALSTRIADAFVESQQVQDFVAGVLPSELSALSAPISDGIGGVVATASETLITSDQFTSLWSAALRAGHIAVSAVLTGNDQALESEGGTISINLDEIATEVASRLEDAGVELPETDIELDPIVLYESDQLAAAQQAAEGISLIGWFLPLIALLLMAGAILVAVDRRGMVAILGFGSAIGLLIGLVGLRIWRTAVLNGIDDAVNQDAAGSIWDTTTRYLTAGTWALIVLAFIVGFIAWLRGPSPRAARLRSWGSATLDGWRRPAAAEPTGFAAFLTEWKRTIEWVIVALGALFLLFGPSPSGLLVIATAAIVLLLVVLVEIFAGRSPAGVATDEPSERATTS